MDKVVASAAEAVADIPSGATLAVGGFGLCGIPSVLIDALLEQGPTDLEAVSNNCGVDEWGLGRLLIDKRMRRMISSYVGENKEFARQYLSRRARGRADPAGHAGRADAGRRLGHPGVLHRDRRRHPGRRGRAAVEVRRPTATWSSPRRRRRPASFETARAQEYVLEEAIVADFGLVRAWKGDRHGNLVYRDSARNFNPLAAMCGRVTIAEVEHLVEPGELDPNDVHTPGVFVQRVVALTPEQAADKRIEKRTVRPATEGSLTWPGPVRRWPPGRPRS